MGKTFIGRRDATGRVVGVFVRSENGREHPLKAYLHWIDHSPDGFEWGYHGSGPAQLALAILGNVTRGSRSYALRCHQQFKREVIACLPRTTRYGADALEHDQSQEVRITEGTVKAWIERHPIGGEGADTEETGREEEER